MRPTNLSSKQLSATDRSSMDGEQVPAELSPRFGADLRAALGAGACIREGSIILARRMADLRAL